MKFRIAFIGFGVVGQGFAKLLLDKKKLLRDKYNFEWEVVAIADKFKGSVVHTNGIDLEAMLKLVQDGKSIEEYPSGIKGMDSIGVIESSEADVIAEVTYTDIKTGGPAMDHVETALQLGKHVVTTNKGPAALKLEELQKLAKDHNAHLMIEGTVLSGTPALNMALKDLAGCEITEIKGILNGTTNYILEQMEDGKSYSDALRTAQELGYAEANPEADVEAWDALGKIVILSRSIMKANLGVNDIAREGITKVTMNDILKASDNNCKLKLIAKAWVQNGMIKAKVGPEEVPNTDPLAHVNGVTNAITFKTDALGDVTIIGPGAGGVEAGYALLTDILALNRTMELRGE